MKTGIKDGCNMNSIDKKKYADFLRGLCANLERKKTHYPDIKEHVNRLRKYADSLCLPDKNPCAQMQWEDLQTRFGKDITPEELEEGLEKMKKRNQKSEVSEQSPEKVEIAY